MDNVLEKQGIPLTVFGGAVPELAPEDLPEGASPFCQDVDFNPGSVFTRGGRQNQLSYFNLYSDKNAGFGATLPGAHAPNEIPWITPTNISVGLAGTYAYVGLNAAPGTTFTGNTCYLQSNNTVALNRGNAISVSFLLATSSTTGGGLLCALTAPPAALTTTQAITVFFAVVMTATGKLVVEFYNGATAVFSNPTTASYNDGTLHLVTVTITAGVVVIYVDGTAVLTSAALGSSVTTTVVNWFVGYAPDHLGGSWPTFKKCIDGFMSDVAVWHNLALSAGNVTALYAAYQSGFQSGLDNYYVTLNADSIWALRDSGNTAADLQNTNPGTYVVFCAMAAFAGSSIINQTFTRSSGADTGAQVWAGNVGYEPIRLGDSVFVFFEVDGLSGSSQAWVTGATDSFGNVYQQISLGTFQNLGGGRTTTMQCFWCASATFAAAASAAITFNLTLTGTGTSTFHVNKMLVYSGTGPMTIDQGPINTTGTISGGVFSSTTVTVGTQELVMSMMGSYNSSTLTGAGWTTYFPSGGGNDFGASYIIVQPPGGSATQTASGTNASPFGTSIWSITLPAGRTVLTTQLPYSQVLAASNYAFGLGSNVVILGMQVEVSGHQTSSDPSAIITVNFPGAPTPFSLSAALPASDGTISFGTPLSNWGYTNGLSLATINSPNFAVNVVASVGPVIGNFYIYAVRIRVWLAPAPSANFNWLKTYEQTDGEIDTLALDAQGRLWDEDVDTNPGQFNGIFTGILANSFAKSITFQDIEYIAFSNLQNGTDVPRQWNGTNLDRISMVGPGAPLNASGGGTGTGGSSSFAIQNIVQGAPVEIRRIAWGTNQSPASSVPGNLLVVYGPGRTGTGSYSSLPPYTPTFGSGTTVVISGVPTAFPLKGGGTLPYNINGTYLVGNVSQQLVGGSEYCPTFTLPAPTTTWAYSADFGVPPTEGWYYQSCIATITMQQPLPNVGVGSSIQISGTGGGPPAGYDGNWPVIAAPNSSQMTINSASLSGGVAQYSYTLAPGSVAPSVGQLVTITNCLNGSGIGDPNVFNTTGNGATIASVGGGTFSIQVSDTVDTIPVQTQTAVPQATATTAGTTFQFDAGAIVNGGSPVSGGSIVQQGQIISGIRKAAYCFLTRSGFITQPSPLTTFNITGGGGTINVTNLATGPPNVVARIVIFTGAGGANFFYIPQEVDITVGGVIQKNTATIVNDNTSTTASFSFSDAVLLSATAMDIPGNNTFNTIELGSSRGLLTYSSRMFAWGEQLKITNLRNLSFDGGAGGVAPTQYPLGWTLDPTNGAGGSLLTSSPVFGWSYQIVNSSGLTKSSYGMLTQAAYQDEFGVPIVEASTLYSVRITVASTAPIASGNLVVDLYSPGANLQCGAFTLPLSSLSTSMQIFTGTLLTKILQPVPQDLLIRIWAQNIPTGAQIQIDRVEPFATLSPVNTVALKASYVNNQEAFDLVTGVCGPAQNMQPINGAAELFDLLYVLKEKSMYSTFDNGVSEPNKWNWKEVSKKVGTIGQNAYDSGEGWLLTADRQGVHFFEGGEPIKVSQEIQPLWDSINWPYGYTLWVRNDPEQKRFTVGVPIPTPNQWMPEFPVNLNPTSPNVILMCNYRELNTGAAMAQTGPIKSTYMGRLMSPEPARKWSFWNLGCPYSDFISRNNSQWPQWFGSGYSDNKIFQLLASQLSDDGNAINSFWISYGFTKAEMADAKGLGLFRMAFEYLTLLATGSGTLNTYVYPESPSNNPYALDVLSLPAISQGDLELGVNIKGNRFFIRVGTNAVGSWFRLSKLVVPLIPDTWSPIRGWNAVSA